jgi:hypothetical protein
MTHSLLRVNQLLQFQTNISEPAIVTELHPEPQDLILVHPKEKSPQRKNSVDDCGTNLRATKPKTPNFIPLYHGRAAKSQTIIPLAKKKHMVVGSISSADIKKAVWVQGAGGKDIIYGTKAAFWLKEQRLKSSR